MDKSLEKSQQLIERYLKKHSQEDLFKLIENEGGTQQAITRLEKMARKNKIDNIKIATTLVLLAVNLSVLGAQVTNGLSSTYDGTYVQNPNFEAGYFNENPYTISINTNKLTQKDIEIILGAIAELDEAMLGMRFEVVFDGKSAYSLEIVKTKTQSSLTQGKSAGVATSYGNQLKGTVYIDNSTFNKSENYAKSVIMHEILHVLGLKHSKEISSVMFPFTLANDLSEQDKANLNTIFPPEIELDSEIAEPELDKSEPNNSEIDENELNNGKLSEDELEK